MSPTQRTIKLLRDRGIPAEKVEQRLPIPGKFVTRDLFNVLDIIALDRGILGIQVTSGTNMSARQKKIHNEPMALAWLKAGARIELHGWAKRGSRGKRKQWSCRVLRARVLPDSEWIFWEETE